MDRLGIDQPKWAHLTDVVDAEALVEDLGGYPVTLVDTAGLRAAAQSESNTDGAMAPPADGSIAGGHVDPVEAEGMRRARDRAARADLKLVVCDAVDWPVLPPESQALIDEAAYLVINKVDLAAAPAETRFRDRPVFPVSALEGRGLTQLLDDIEGEVVASLGVSGAAPSLTRQRHRRALEDCRDALGRALEASRHRQRKSSLTPPSAGRRGRCYRTRISSR